MIYDVLYIHDAPLNRGFFNFLTAAGVESIHLYNIKDVKNKDLKDYKMGVCFIQDGGDLKSVKKLKKDIDRRRFFKNIMLVLIGINGDINYHIETLKLGFFEYVNIAETEAAAVKLKEILKFFSECKMRKFLEGWYEFKLKSQYNFIKEVNHFISKLKYQTEMSEEDISDVEYAFLEIGNNAVEHGNLKDINKNIKISYAIFKDKLIIKVEDEGEGFKFNEIKGEELKDLFSSRGRGLYLVGELMDNLTFNDKGNICLMEKSF